MADPNDNPTSENDRMSPKGALSQETRERQGTRDEFQQRLDKLGKKLDQASKGDQTDQPQSSSSGLGIAMRMGSEFVAAVLIGGAMGWFLDKWMGSTPFMLFLFLMVGFAAGTMNIIRVGKRLNEKQNLNASKDAKDKNYN